MKFSWVTAQTPAFVIRPALGVAALALVALALPGAVSATGPQGVLDNRAWELVSPAEKSGGGVGAPGTTAAGVLRAAAGGGALAFGSEASFGEAAGAAPINQYLATRGAEGWSTANVTPPQLSGTYDGDPYLALSADLLSSLLSGGWACRGGGEECAAENPPLGPGGPVGYRNAYLNEGSAYTPLITAANFPFLPSEPQDFHLAFEGASPDLRHVVVSSESGLYEWSGGAIEQLSASPGAALPGPAGAVSSDGSRVYFTESEDAFLYLREAGSTRLVSAGGSFAAATADGRFAFYLAAGHLFRYDALAEASQDLTPGGEVTRLLAASLDGAYLYYLTPAGLWLLHGAGPAIKLLVSPPSPLPAQTAADGARLFFTSPLALVSTDTDGRPDAYEWEAQGVGSCAEAPGCLALISSGRTGSATFAAVSASGQDAYFATDAQLLAGDPDAALDLYDAREAGGFPEPPALIPCIGDACQAPPPAPDDPTPGTATYQGPVNPPAAFTKSHCARRKPLGPGKGHGCRRKRPHHRPKRGAAKR